ncbi:hypothetical protein F2A38_10355 [Pseudomonas chlororaphis]|uniref:Mobile element protein n=1 Tax=Pseudomonas chlororaphis TaxID=587753 RepID=A0AB34C950_9PSED|nr:hypothetical protein [Pseudomonas chlororaphis]KAA5843662.1 hypothetical protein F2A38_10355 [Pseudomonas chlororaphis]
MFPTPDRKAWVDWSLRLSGSDQRSLLAQMRLETIGIVFDNGIPYAGARLKHLKHLKHLKRLTPSRNARKAVENLVDGLSSGNSGRGFPRTAVCTVWIGLVRRQVLRRAFRT